jgi:predicted glycoside hydrolase/deacetylase ChbG (UPF0249 family)
MEQNARASGPLRNRRLSKISTVKQYLVSRAVSALAKSFRKKLEQTGLLYPTHFYGLSQTGFLDASAIRRILENLPPGTSELMCHPGYRDVELERTGTRLLTQREIEIHGLTATSVTNLAAAGGIRLCNYRNILELTQRMGAAA